MMQEADEPTLESDLCTMAEFDHGEQVREALVAEIESRASANGDDRYRWWWRGLEVSDEDFQTLLLQFNALGLVEHSKRNRSVKDTANYWTLTPYGHTRLVQLRAIETGDESLARSDDPIVQELEQETAEGEEQ